MRHVLVAAPDESVRDAARRTQKGEVGTLVVVDSGSRPLGVLTDRDVALRCVADGRDPERTPISAVMTAPAVCVREATPIEDALSRMVAIPVRRLVVTDDAGVLVGILALDDVGELLAEESGQIGRLLARRSSREP